MGAVSEITRPPIHRESNTIKILPERKNSTSTDDDIPLDAPEVHAPGVPTHRKPGKKQASNGEYQSLASIRENPEDETYVQLNPMLQSKGEAFTALNPGKKFHDDNNDEDFKDENVYDVCDVQQNKDGTVLIQFNKT